MRLQRMHLIPHESCAFDECFAFNSAGIIMNSNKRQREDVSKQPVIAINDADDTSEQPVIAINDADDTSEQPVIAINDADDTTDEDHSSKTMVQLVYPREHAGQMTFSQLSRADMDHCIFQSSVFDNVLFPDINGTPVTQQHLDYWLDQWHPLRTNPAHHTWLYVHRHVSSAMDIFNKDVVVDACSTDAFPSLLSMKAKQDLVQQAIDICQPFKRKPHGQTQIRTNKAQKQTALDAVAEIAKQHGCTSGKWMLRPPRDQVDRVWRIIAKATFDGKLGPSAKIAPMGEKKGTCTHFMKC